MKENNVNKKLHTEKSEIDSLKSKLKSQEDLLKKVEAYFENQKQKKYSYELEKKFHENVCAKEKDFCKNKPDYPQATAYLKDRRNKDLELWGIKDADKRQMIIEAEMAAFAQFSLNNGNNPAERAYEVALSWGYDHDNLLKKDTHVQPTKRVKSLSTVAGKADMPVSMEGLDYLSDDEFDMQWDQLITS